MPDEDNSIDITPKRAAALLNVNKANIAKKLEAGKTLRQDEIALLNSISTFSEADNGQRHEHVTYVTSKVELSKALNVSRPTIDMLWRKPGCPKSRPDGSYIVADWRRHRDKWCNRHGPHSKNLPDVGNFEDDQANNKAKISAELLAIELSDARFESEIKRGEWIRKGEAADAISRCNEQVKQELLRRFIQTAPAEYTAAGMNELEWRRINERHITEALEYLHSGVWKE